MLIKFLAHGKGRTQQAIDYLLDERDHTGEVRDEVRVVRGDPAMVARVGDQIPREYKYSSCVIAWHENDNPSLEQIENTIDEWEKTAFPGMENRASWCAVLHRESDGSEHVHIVAARTDLETGKAYNPAPPYWEKRYGELKEWLNAREGWREPDEHARELRPANIIEAKNGLPREKTTIHQFISQRVEAGLIHNRDDVVAALDEVGLELTRDGKDYISVKPVGEDRKGIRLRGTIYEREWERANDLARTFTREEPDRARSNDRRASQDVGELAQRVIDRRETISRANQERYRDGLLVAHARSHGHDNERNRDRGSVWSDDHGGLDAGTLANQQRARSQRRNRAVGIDQGEPGPIRSSDRGRRDEALDRVAEWRATGSNDDDQRATGGRLGAVADGRDYGTLVENLERAEGANREADLAGEEAQRDRRGLQAVLIGIADAARKFAERVIELARSRRERDRATRYERMKEKARSLVQKNQERRSSQEVSRDRERARNAQETPQIASNDKSRGLDREKRERAQKREKRDLDPNLGMDFDL